MPHKDYLCLSCLVKPIDPADTPYCSLACSRQFAKLSGEEAKASYWQWRRVNTLDTYMADKLIYPLFADTFKEQAE